MTFCPHCGKQLADGEVCSCTAAPQGAPTAYDETINIENMNPAAQPAPQPVEPQAEQYYAPQPAPAAPVYYPQEPVQEKAPARTDYPEGYKIKKKYVAVILAWMFGPLGLHNFYLGNNSKAIAQLLLSTVGAILVVGPVVSLVWSMVEGILLLVENYDRDAQGYKIQTLEEALNKKD